MKTSRWRQRPFPCILLAALLAAVIMGCGDGRPKRVPVSGRVTIDGEPLTFGVVRLYPKNARAASAKIGPDGRFTLSTFGGGDGAVLGTHPVSVTAVKHLSETKREWHTPKKYDKPDASGLTAVIDGKGEPLELELTWDGGKPFVEVIHE